MTKLIIVAQLFLISFASAFSVKNSPSVSKPAAAVVPSPARRSAVASCVAAMIIATNPPHALAGDNTAGYTTTSRGLTYKVTKPPADKNSASPQRGQNVKTSYTLYVNGFPEDTPKSEKIDSSKGVLGEKPFGFLAGVSQVIKGWDLAIMDMKQGEARRLVVPSDLGYGAKGAGGKIPGGATLYFDVELVEIGDVYKMGEAQQKWLEDNPI